MEEPESNGDKTPQEEDPQSKPTADETIIEAESKDTHSLAEKTSAGENVEESSGGADDKVISDEPENIEQQDVIKQDEPVNNLNLPKEDEEENEKAIPQEEEQKESGEATIALQEEEQTETGEATNAPQEEEHKESGEATNASQEEEIKESGEATNAPQEEEQKESGEATNASQEEEQKESVEATNATQEEEQKESGEAINAPQEEEQKESGETTNAPQEEEQKESGEATNAPQEEEQKESGEATINAPQEEEQKESGEATNAPQEEEQKESGEATDERLIGMDQEHTQVEDTSEENTAEDNETQKVTEHEAEAHKDAAAEQASDKQSDEPKDEVPAKESVSIQEDETADKNNEEVTKEENAETPKQEPDEGIAEVKIDEVKTDEEAGHDVDVKKSETEGDGKPTKQEGDMLDAETSESFEEDNEETQHEKEERTTDSQENAKTDVETLEAVPDRPTQLTIEGDEKGSYEIDSQEGGVSDITRLVERSGLEQQHRSLLVQRRQLLTRNQRIQQRLSEHFSRKTDDAERVEKNVAELEQRYTRYLYRIREQQRIIAEERQRQVIEVAQFRAQVDQQMEVVANEYAQVVELRRAVSLKSRSSRSGRLMSVAEVDGLISRERGKEAEVHQARLESLRRETRLARLEKELRDSEELAGGIHLIDFEQLKIENQTFAEKIEERNEDLTKLRRKVSSTVQILTHLKERIQFEQAENARHKHQLHSVSADVTHGRESLAVLKQKRDHVRSRTVSQRDAAGLLGHEALLRDFEQRVDEEAQLARELQALRRDYANNQQMSNEIRQIERTKKARQRTCSTLTGID